MKLPNPVVKSAVHQFHSGSAYGDAVTNGMLLLQEHLRALDLESEIFVEHVDERLADRLSPMSLLERLRPEDVLLIHHSMGHDQLSMLLGLACRKALVYHNITPAHFFAPGSPFHRYSILGREQLSAFVGKVEAVLADSEYNASELRSAGFDDVTVLPVLVDERKFRSLDRPHAQPNAIARPWTILFVGRICENKGHLSLIAVASEMARRFPAPFRFNCVGSYDPNDPYYLRLAEKIAEAGVESFFRLTGKVSEEALVDAYDQADCYLSLSGHEGFGVPLIEAMLCRLPVVALDRACVGETLDGCGILIDRSDADTVVPVLEKILLDRAFRRDLLERQSERTKAFAWLPIQFRISGLLARLQIGHRAPSVVIDPLAAPLRWRIEGPFDSSYSLALLNRELARALDRELSGRVGLFSTEGPGDFAADLTRIDDADGRIAALHRLGHLPLRPEIVVRDLYPPRVRDARGTRNVGFFAWEESSVPHDMVDDFNMSLDAIFTISDFIGDALRGSGCRVPIFTIGAGVDHLLNIKPKPLQASIGSGYRFLHVSSAFPRKGVDVLVEAFCRTFTSADDVTLVIKTFANPHNDVLDDIDRRRMNPRCPRIVLIERDMEAGELLSLYQACDAYVSPSRAEGFGLPIAEAMLTGLPVIVTGWGGPRQFCSPETALLIDYHLERSTSHLAAIDALWAVPHVDSLCEHLRLLASGRDTEVERRVERARALLLQDFTWKKVAERAIRAMADAPDAVTHKVDAPVRIGWVTTWNERCGIADYSRFLVERFSRHAFHSTILGKIDSSCGDDSVDYVAAWNAPPHASEPLHVSLIRRGVDCVIVQFNFGYFDVEALSRSIEILDAHGIPTIVMFHATKDVVRPDLHLSLGRGVSGLGKAAALLVHSLDDLQRLERFGLGRRAALFPHGVLNRTGMTKSTRRRALGIPEDAYIISTFGFMLPHKGLLEMCEAFRILSARHAHVYWFAVNALYPVGESSELSTQLAARVKLYGLESKVRIITTFLDEEVALSILETSDVIVFPYQATGESSSAAVRHGLSTGRLVAVTPLPIFDDVGDSVFRLSGVDALGLASDLERLVNSSIDVAAVVAAQRRFIREADWDVVARRLESIVLTIVRGVGPNPMLPAAAPAVELMEQLA